MKAVKLLQQATLLYDDPSTGLKILAEQQAWQTGFSSGAEWMRFAMSQLRGQDIPVTNLPYQQVGLLKYGLASLGASVYLGLFIRLEWWLLLPGFILVFYALEVQTVFLFPLAIDGADHLFAESRRWTAHAGGTCKAMQVVMPIASVMLLGGFFGQGFIRAWALGCLAIVIWYEQVRQVTLARP